MGVVWCRGCGECGVVLWRSRKSLEVVAVVVIVVADVVTQLPIAWNS